VYKNISSKEFDFSANRKTTVALGGFAQTIKSRRSSTVKGERKEKVQKIE
jgi:hypothetical protein